MPQALITGGSTGLGRALAAGLVEHGWQVVITGRDETRLATAARDLGPAATAVAGDVTDPRHRVVLAETVGDGLDLLVNNASTLGSSLRPVLDLDDDVLRAVWETNVVAPAALVRAVRPALRPGGAVIAVSSDAAVESYATWGAYAASKTALDLLTRTLAVEDPDIRYWAVDPGDMRTQMHQDAFPGEDISDRPRPESVVPALLALLTERPPSGRYRASDLVPVV
jgi:NAD(P)-dependent dehydrogenase (short-subunit alcohol dehydrogenase family)